MLTIAEHLLATRGYEATSLEDIARAAGVTRPVVYDHLGDKPHVLVTCVRRLRERLALEVSTALADADPDDLRDVLRHGAEAWFTLFEQDPGRWSLLFVHVDAVSDELGQLSRGTVQWLVGVSGAFGPTLGDDAREAFAAATLGAAEQLARWWRRRPDIPRERLVGYFAGFMYGAAMAADPQIADPHGDSLPLP